MYLTTCGKIESVFWTISSMNLYNGFLVNDVKWNGICSHICSGHRQNAITILFPYLLTKEWMGQNSNHFCLRGHIHTGSTPFPEHITGQAKS